MKTYALLTILFLIVTVASEGKIKNGYGIDIIGARKSLISIKLLLKEDKTLTIFQRIKMREKIKDIIGFITYYELTEKLLEQFETIAPDLYFEVDALTDRKGRPVDIYLRFVPEKEMPSGVAGTTNLAQDSTDPDAYSSEYGPRTVSIRIRAEKKSLQLLAHELGHVKYQVPNLADYVKFCTEFYFASTYHLKSLGHNDIDPSGKLAREFAKRFREKYLNFIKVGQPKIESCIVLLQGIKTVEGF